MKGHHGNGRFRNMVARAALNRHCHDVACLFLRLVLRGLLDFANHDARVVIRFLLDALNNHVACFVLRHLRDALKLRLALFFQILRGLFSFLRGGLLARAVFLRFRSQAIQLGLLALKGRFAHVEVVRLLVEGLLALGYAALAALNLGAAIANLAIQFVLQANNLFLRLKDAFLLLLFRTTLRVFQQISGIFFRTPDILLLNIFPIHVACRTARRKRGDDCQQGQQKRQSASHSFFAEFSISFHTDGQSQKACRLTPDNLAIKQHKLGTENNTA